jgi:RHS repeat-associated protein
MGLATSDGCMSYAYDGFDRLSQVSAIGSCNMTTINYAYDSFDRQVSRSWASGSSAFHYDGLSQQPVLERTTGVSDTAYDLGPAGKSVAVNQGSLPLSSTNSQYILDDGHTNAAFIDNASSTTVCVARFDPWGAPYGTGTSYAQPCTAGAGTADKHFYRNARLDESTGDYQFGSRTYAPLKASFLEPDTYRTGTAAMALSVGTDPLTRNRYSYVNGDPVDNFDPSGHTCTQFNAQGDLNSCWHGSLASDQRNTAVAAAQQAAHQVCNRQCQAIYARKEAIANAKAKQRQAACAWYDVICNEREALDDVNPCDAFGLHWCAAVTTAVSQGSQVRPSADGACNAGGLHWCAAVATALSQGSQIQPSADGVCNAGGLHWCAAAQAFGHSMAYALPTAIKYDFRNPCAAVTSVAYSIVGAAAVYFGVKEGVVAVASIGTALDVLLGGEAAGTTEGAWAAARVLAGHGTAAAAAGSVLALANSNLVQAQTNCG